jgi:hypothetical protein
MIELAIMFFSFCFFIWYRQPKRICANCGKERKGRHLINGWGGEQFCKPDCPTRDLMS